MGIYDAAAKDTFASRTQSQNIGRLLLLVVQHIYATFNSTRMLRSAAEQWTDGDVEKIDRADLRLCFWQTARECREIVLKTLTLLYFVENSGLSKPIDSVIELVGGILDSREAIRKRGMVGLNKCSTC